MKILFFCMLMLCLIFCKAQEEKQKITLQKMISYVEEMQKNNVREDTLSSRQSKHAPSVHVNILKASMLGDGENFWDNQEAIELVFAANLAIDLISTRDDFGYLIQSIAFWYERNRYTRHFFLKADEIHQDVRRLARSAPFNSGGTEGMHFDDIFTYREICQRWEEFEAWVLREVNVAQSSREHWDRQGRRDFLILMGMVSHSVQDFYAHSNLVRLILDHNRRSSIAIQPCWEDIVALEKHAEASKSLNYGLWQWCIQSNETVTSESEYSSEKWLGLQTGSWGKKDKLYDKRHSQWKKPWKHRDEDHSLALALSGRSTIHWKEKMLSMLEEKYRMELLYSLCSRKPRKPIWENWSYPDNGKKALVIGARYDILAQGSLPECLQDARAISTLLQNRYGFSSSAIALMTGEEATKKKIMTVLKTLQNQSKKGDTIFVYFSGHGTQVTDEGEKDEEDGLDEAILTYDLNYIVDDDWGKAVADMEAKGANVLAIFDSCYSGTGLKGLSLKENDYFSSKFLAVPQWSEKAIVGTGKSEIFLEKPRIPKVDPKEEKTPRTIFYSSCEESQVSWTMSPKGHSAFTYHFLQALENDLPADYNRDGNVTFTEMIWYLKRSLEYEFLPCSQSPTMEGEAMERTLYPVIHATIRPQGLTALPPERLKLHEFLEKLILRQASIPSYAPWQLAMKVQPDKREFLAGEYLTLEVTAPANGYLVLLCITERGEVALLYPNGESKHHYLQAGKTIQVPSSNAKWEIQIHPPRGKEWLVAYFFEKNPLQGYDLPYTLSQDFLVTGKIDELHYIKTLPWETAEKSILELSTPDANPAQNVSEKWTKSVWGYTTK